LVYEEPGPDRRRAHTVAGIAAELGVSWPTVATSSRRRDEKTNLLTVMQALFT
jgi:hypothetical protein